MKPRPVVTVNDDDGTPIVRVPLSHDAKLIAEIELADWQRLLAMNLSPNVGYVGHRKIYPTLSGKNGRRHLLSRVLTGATWDERVIFKDGNSCNLRRSNIEVLPIIRRQTDTGTNLDE